MFIQGDLQAVFDALYSVGAIDPVLNADWKEISNEMKARPDLYSQAMKIVNDCHGDKNQLVERLMSLDAQTVNFIAVEVAREFAEFTDRKDVH
ncbi:MAG: cytochrome [Bdellovibrionaceae bacterium]|nr:cytochrome [Pseudobdellovibrionaceae bacterium]